MFKVVDWAKGTEGGTDYWIKNEDTGEVRILRDCMLLDMEVFDEYDFETECEEA